MPGVYRIRVVGTDMIAYIGQTGRSLRERLSALRTNTLKDDMPWNDPHTAAPSLWAWHDAEGYEYECSGAATPDIETRNREGLECYLLWQYRILTGGSTLCNHGRFHQHYSKSQNRSTNRRGTRLSPGVINPAGGPSMPPLMPYADPTAQDWMRLAWQGPIDLKTESFQRSAPNTAGLYRLHDTENGKCLYIGQTTGLQKRLHTHAVHSYHEGQLVAFYVPMRECKQLYQLLEMENDLIGAYYDWAKESPAYQFQNNAKNTTMTQRR
jgi:hypothetical protein